MKVSALHQPAAPHQPPRAVVAEPSRPFRSLLEEAPAGHDDGTKAFCEGGLLGETDSPDTALPDMAAPAVMPQARSNAPEAFRPFDATSEPQLQGHMSRLAPSVAPRAPNEAWELPMGIQRMSNVASITGGIATPTPASMKASVGGPCAAPLRARAPAPTPAPTRAKTSLTLTQGDVGGLHVIAAAPGLDREAANRLRKLMSDVAAQFGLDLSTLQLNGLQVEKPVIVSTGGPHGR